MCISTVSTLAALTPLPSRQFLRHKEGALGMFRRLRQNMPDLVFFAAGLAQQMQQFAEKFNHSNITFTDITSLLLA